MDSGDKQGAEQLADRDVLIVIDDVWNRAHLTPFLQGGEHCARLITTRNSDTLPPKTTQINLDAMRQAEAISLLKFDILDEEDSEIKKLAHRLGKWPLLLKLVNATLRERVNIRGQSLSAALAYVNKALDKRGLTAFDSRNPEERSQAVSITLKVSIDLLNEDEINRFSELAIFPEDVDIPLEVVEKLWSHAGYDDFDTEALCERLHQFSLLLNFDPVTNHIRLHDVVRYYLLIEQSSQLPSIHQRFLNAYRLKDWTQLPPVEPYLWDFLAYHLFESKQTQTLRNLLFNYSWLDIKLSVSDVNSLLSDFDFFPEDSELKMIQGALRLSSNQLTHDRGQLSSHLIGRLQSHKSSNIESLLTQSMFVENSRMLPLFRTF